MKGLYLIFLFLTLFFNIEAFGQLRFKGVDKSLQDEIRKKFPSVRTSQINRREIDKILKFVFSKGNYESLEVISNKGILTLVGTQIKTISLITIEGNILYSDSEIKRISRLSENVEFDRASVLNGIDRVKQFYNDNGYLNSLVTVQFTSPSSSEIIVRVTVSEGQLCKIDSVKISSENSEIKKIINEIAEDSKGLSCTKRNQMDIKRQITEKLISEQFLSVDVIDPKVTYLEGRLIARLQYEIKNPYQYGIQLKGNKDLTSIDIRSELNLDDNKRLGISPGPEILDRIYNIYKSLGYANVQINLSTESQSKYKRDLVFDIVEGNKVKIRKIDILGSISRGKSYYRGIIRSKSSSLVQLNYYNKADIEKGAKSLITELQNQGYLRARIQSMKVEFGKLKDSVSIYLTIDEGPLTVLNKIEFAGLKAIKKEDLISVMPFKVGSPLRLKDIEGSLIEIRNYYQVRGFLDVKIENERDNLVTYVEDNTKVNMKYVISEGPKVKIETIIIDGNNFTKTNVIMNELVFKTGDVLTPKLVADSNYNLQKTGFFTRVSIRMLEEGTPISDRTIIVTLVERDPGTLSIGLGVNTEFGLTARGFVGISYRNLGGTGRAISSRIELKRVTDIDFFDHKITVGYLEPYLIGSKIKGRISALRSVNINRRTGTDNLGRTEGEARESSQIGFSLEREFSRNFRGQLNIWNLAVIRDFTFPSNITATTQNIASVGLAVDLDHRNNAFNPSRGSFLRTAIEYADPAFGSSAQLDREVRYFRATSRASVYFPLSTSSLVLAQSLSGGFLANYAEQAAAPRVKQFFIGGRSTIRGFEINSLPFESNLKDGTGAVYTDTYFWVTQSELRFKIYGDIGGVLFYDGGAVVISGIPIANTYRESAGFGLRYNTPVGPVSAEYGFILDRNSGESSGRFHFSIGTF